MCGDQTGISSKVTPNPQDLPTVSKHRSHVEELHRLGLLLLAGAKHRDGDSDNQHNQTDDDCYGFHFESVCVVFALVK